MGSKGKIFLLIGNMQVTMQIHHLVITLHILEIAPLLTIFPDVCVKKVIHTPRLDNEQHMIISELSIMLLLAKCKMYNINGFTMSNIDTLVYIYTGLHTPAVQNRDNPDSVYHRHQELQDSAYYPSTYSEVNLVDHHHCDNPCMYNLCKHHLK